jgi:two-component system sensor histidine kinase KdpD
MNEPERPDPDEILARVKRDETAAMRGKLKIFFGMSPGVGKTFAMLQAARQKQAEGCEVVVGIVETHGRKETEALLEGMPIMPRTQHEYRGATLQEMDLDAILTWHPGLAVVDELAHTNAPGSRHPKRYQDVLELLDAGIDAYTTLNVQHVASRSDTVRQISGVTVSETVPDSVLDLADEMVLIDLTPEQLRGRLAEGKVYLGERATWAAENFFRESNLTALREMALRLVAEHVDRDLRDIMSEQKIAGPWKSGDRLLVAVSASPYSERLIRYTRRLAASMEASWIVANIEMARALSAEEQTRLTRYLALARQLGAEVISTPGQDVAETLLRVARQHNVTQIVIGKPLGARWTSFWKRDPLRWLMRHSGNIDIHMIPSEESIRPRSDSIEERLRHRSGDRDGRHGGLAGHFRLHRLLERSAFLFARGCFRGHASAALAHALSRRPQRAPLGFSLHPAALHLLHQPPPRRHDVRRVFRHRARGRSSRHAIARTRTIGAPPRGARHCPLSLDPLARRQPRS